LGYVGNTPADKFLTLAKQNFSTSATTSYTLDSAVSSTQDIALFINNVRQSPVDAYSVSGTALTLTSATAGTDEMYCVFLGKTVGTVSPASDSVTTAMLNDDAVTGAKLNTDVISAQTALGATPADTDELLVSDAGVLKRVDYSHLKSSGGTESFYVSKTGSADQTLTNQTYTKMTFDSEGVDAGSNFASDKFTVPSAGKYFFEAQVKGQSSTDAKLQIFVTAIYKNGTMVVRNHNELTTGYEKMISKNVSIILDLAASDYIEVYCYLGQASSTTLTVAGDGYGATHFLGYKLA
jgi:hypothetical protein